MNEINQQLKRQTQSERQTMMNGGENLQQLNIIVHRHSPGGSRCSACLSFITSMMPSLKFSFCHCAQTKQNLRKRVRVHLYAPVYHFFQFRYKYVKSISSLLSQEKRTAVAMVTWSNKQAPVLFRFVSFSLASDLSDRIMIPIGWHMITNQGLIR